jgi:hypothetical protein
MKKAEKKPIVPGRGKEKANQILQKSGNTGKTPKQVVRKHIQDKNDVITEEDFKNLNISVDISNDTAHEVLEIQGDKKRPKDEDKDPVVITPWDVISE